MAMYQLPTLMFVFKAQDIGLSSQQGTFSDCCTYTMQEDLVTQHDFVPAGVRCCCCAVTRLCKEQSTMMEGIGVIFLCSAPFLHDPLERARR